MKISFDKGVTFTTYLGPIEKDGHTIVIDVNKETWQISSTNYWNTFAKKVYLGTYAKNISKDVILKSY